MLEIKSRFVRWFKYACGRQTDYFLQFAELRNLLTSISKQPSSHCNVFIVMH